MAVNGQAYPAVLLDADGNVLPITEAIQFTDASDQPGTGGGGLALTGWTEDASNPANVNTDGGTLTVQSPSGNDGLLVTDHLGVVIITAGEDTAGLAVAPGNTLFSPAITTAAPGGTACFAAGNGAGATVALDAGGLDVSNVGTLTAATVDATTAALTPGSPGDDVLFCNGGAITGFSTIVPNSVPSITGALSTVLDAAAKDVLTSIISALTTLGLATDSTT